MISPAAPAAAARPRLTALRHRAWAIAGHVLLIGLALAAWAYAAKHADPHRISGYGLLPALPAAYYVALAALSAGFAIAVVRRAPGLLLALYVLALILMLHGTTPLIYSEPRYAWTYKHIGVASYISHFGSTDRSIDIYQNWPGFFALLAALHGASGISLLALAPWSEVFFECAYAAAVVFLLGALTADRRVLLTAAWLFVLANWVGQDYLAPQSFAYLLSLVLIGVAIRCAPPPREGEARTRAMRRWWAWLARASAGRRPAFEPQAQHAPLRAPAALGIGLVLFAAITISHQLSPLLCVAAIAGFALTTRRIGPAPLIVMVAMEAGWVALAWPLIASRYGLLGFSPLERPSTPGGNASWALPGFGYSALAARASVVAVVVLAAISLWRRRRAGHFDLPIVATALAPALVLAVQAYSGEGAFRVYMFALPWLCFLAASLLLGARAPARARARLAAALTRTAQPPASRTRLADELTHPEQAPTARARLRPVPAGLALAGVSLLLAATFLFASFGREAVNYISPADLAVEMAYERDAPPGSAVLFLAPNVPNRMTWRYAAKQVWGGSFSPSLTEDPHFRGHALGVSDLGAIESKLRSLQATQAYVMIAPSQIRFVEAHGLLAPGSVEALDTALLASNNFELVMRDGEALLFRMLKAGERPR